MYANQAFLKIQRDASVNTIAEGYQPIGTISSTTLSNLQLPTDMTSLWVKGPSGTSVLTIGIGKTTWALTVSNKPALFVRHLDTLREFRNGYHKSIIFDDMSFQHLPRQAQIHLVDRYHAQQIHVRYAVVNLPANIPKIFLSNDSIFTYDQAIFRRLTLVNLEFDQE